MELSTIFRLLAVLLFSAGLAACNTIQGAGEDIEQGGEAVSESAEEVEDEID